MFLVDLVNFVDEEGDMMPQELSEPDNSVRYRTAKEE